MKYGPYEFKREDAFRFAQHVGIPAIERGGNLHLKVCPYCRRTERNNQKSFAISLENGTFHCLRSSCGASGNMVTLSKDFDFSLGTEIDEYFRPRKKYRRLKTPEKPIEPKPEAIAYLETRGISESTARKYEITVKNDSPNILVFPFFDEKGQLQSVKYRKTDFDKERDGAKEWFEKETRPILFGMKQATDFKKPLVITEGQLDSLSLAEAGIENAVSVPTGAKGMTFMPNCWDWIHKFPEIIIFGDHEKGKITLLDEFSQRLNIPIRHVREEDYKDCKDANEILLKYGTWQLVHCVEKAERKKIAKIVDLADVSNVNFYKWKKLPTGIRALDRYLYGGIPFGGVTLIAGKPGEGKSTLASQFIANARENDFRCFVYSGELTKELFKAWLNFQVAGSHHIRSQINQFGDEEYGISETNESVISEWYRDHIYFYDSEDISEERDETEGIIKLLDQAIAQYGIDVVLIDNLMTALDLEATGERDKYERQSKFVKALVRLARRHNIVCLLVAHQRKNNISTNSNDEISGSGDIANLAMITLAYEKQIDDEGGEYRVLKLAKNRLFGRLNTSGWTMSFDERSRRIGVAGQDLNYEYSWSQTDEDGLYEMDGLDEDAPFD